METGERLVQANRIFQADGYTIKLWDAYRPIRRSAASGKPSLIRAT